MNTRLIFTLESSGSAMRIGRADGEARCIAGQLCLIHYTATQYSFLARYATINSTCSVIFAANRILINQVLPSTVTPALSVCLSLPPPLSLSLSILQHWSSLLISSSFESFSKLKSFTFQVARVQEWPIHDIGIRQGRIWTANTSNWSP